MGCHLLPQGIFLTQESNLLLLHLLHWKADYLSLSYLARRSNRNKRWQLYMLGFPGGSVVKNPYDNAGHSGYAGPIPELGRSPGGGHGNPLQYSCLENPHGQRSLVGYGPQTHKELDTREAAYHSPAHTLLHRSSTQCPETRTNQSD